MTSLNDHINSLMSKIAEEKKAEELGSTSFPQPDNGDTKTFPDGGLHDDNEQLTGSTVDSANVANKANQDPGGMSPEKVQILTADDGPEKEPKSGKDQEETSGPKAVDCGAKTAAELADDILGAIAKLTGTGKEASEAPKTEAPKTEAPKTEAPKTEAPKTEKTAEEQIKEAAEKYPEALQAGYEFANKVAEFLEANAASAAQTDEEAKVTAEAENDAIKVAEFLMGLNNEKQAMGMEGEIPPEMAGGDVVTPEEVMAGGAEGGMPGGEPSEEEIVAALSEALAEEGVSPEELAAALAAEGGMEADPGMEVTAADKQAAQRKSAMVAQAKERLAELRKAGHLKK